MTDVVKLLVPESKHSTRGPSGAKRWMNCAASPQLIEKIEQQFGKLDSSDDADEGSAAHTVLTHCLMNNDDAWVHSGKVVVIGKKEFTVDADMVAGVQVAIDRVRALRAEYPNGILYVERVLKSNLDDDAWGAGDICFEVPAVAIFIFDFKYGEGVVVEPTAEQMKQYGYMAYEMRGEHMREANEPQKIICGVIQPRIPHPRGTIREHSYEVAEVEEWFASEVVPALWATRDPNATFKMGEWCQFCPGKKRNKCPAFQQAIIDAPTNIEPKAMTAKELGAAIAKLELLVPLLDKLNNEAFQRMQAGESIDNRKLVHKKSSRVLKQEQEIDGVKIKVEDAAVATFGLDAYDPATLKGVTGFEKLTGGDQFVSLWAYKPDAGLTLAPLSDKRPAVRPLMERFEEPANGVPV